MRNEVVMCWWDEAFTINEMLEETNMCKGCHHKECPNCGKEFDLKKNKEKEN